MLTNQAREHGRDLVGRRQQRFGFGADYVEYPGLQTGIRVQSETLDKTTEKTTREDRFYVSCLAADAMNGAQWATIIRRRWAVDNECHNTFDRILREDDRPWVRAPEAIVNVILLRRIAYTILALHRVRRSASDGERPSWTAVLHTFYVALSTATATTIAGLRLPMQPQATSRSAGGRHPPSRRWATTEPGRVPVVSTEPRLGEGDVRARARRDSERQCGSTCGPSRPANSDRTWLVSHVNA